MRATNLIIIITIALAACKSSTPPDPLDTEEEAVMGPIRLGIRINNCEQARKACDAKTGIECHQCSEQTLDRYYAKALAYKLAAEAENDLFAECWLLKRTAALGSSVQKWSDRQKYVAERCSPETILREVRIPPRR